MQQEFTKKLKYVYVFIRLFLGLQLNVVSRELNFPSTYMFAAAGGVDQDHSIVYFFASMCFYIGARKIPEKRGTLKPTSPLF